MMVTNNPQIQVAQITNTWEVYLPVLHQVLTVNSGEKPHPLAARKRDKGTIL
jgi:hypothetical protein